MDLQWFTKAGQETLLKEAIDLKSQVLAVKEKYAELDIKGLEEEEEEESLTDSVPLSYQPETIAAHCSSLLPWTTAVASYHKTPVGLEEDLASDPTTPQAQMKAKGLLQYMQYTFNVYTLHFLPDSSQLSFLQAILKKEQVAQVKLHQLQLFPLTLISFTGGIHNSPH